MKKIVLISALIFTALASCVKEADSCVMCEKPDTFTLTMSFQTDSYTPESRAFFDNSPAAEPWEKNVSTLTIYVYDLRNTETPVFHKYYYDQTSLGELTFSIDLPDELLGVECEALAVANENPIGAISYDDLLNYTENGSRGAYNSGYFSGNANKCVRLKGFVMSGRQKFTITSLSGENISVSLRRTVAKLAFRTRISKALQEQYSLTHIIPTNITINNQYGSMPVFSECGKGSTSQEGQFSELYNDEYCNTLYLFPNSGRDNNNALLTFSVVTDTDGNLNTTSDQRNYYLTCSLGSGAGAKLFSGRGEVKRNAYYRITATINSLYNTRSVLDSSESEITDAITFEIE